ncbi:DUF1285 domain-containing protein [Chelatococcus sp. SYSU_G07232]|uniref:DUF1285 domain-containing protein n=1 Tax=Chelatococcus albus TaxID=3047466 RepID=A0ABT7AIZ5_9HYPH|nr:DUF1285 domain-containing protein [Chelatococcus sp. SYSU_G07232]MDJ1159328.1 DUF1285 domain-containing protein [Chelatococcus sp. SYSU_G07232]
MQHGADGSRAAGRATADASPPGLERLFASLGGTAGGPATPRPVERWNPPYCGDIDMRVAADGTWFYSGTPIRRPALVKLFASILRKDPERYVLVTPVECVGIHVADVPFLAVEMAVTEAGGARTLHFRTNVDDVVAAGSDHPLRFATAEDGGLMPYVHVRGGLWARLTRALTHDLVALGEERMMGGANQFGVASGDAFFVMAPASEVSE